MDKSKKIYEEKSGRNKKKNEQDRSKASQFSFGSNISKISDAVDIFGSVIGGEIKMS